MRELDSLRHIIDSYDETLRETFLHRMEVSLLVAKEKLKNGQYNTYDDDREEEIIARVTTGLSPEMSAKARVLWQTLMRISRGRQYRYFIQNDPNLKLNHELKMKEQFKLFGVLISPQNTAQLASTALSYETRPCASSKSAIDAVKDGSADFAAITIENLYDTKWLYSLLFDAELFVNAIIRTKQGPLLVLVSKHLYNDPENSIISVSYIVPPKTGTISQSLAIFSENNLFIEFMGLRKIKAPDLVESTSMIFVDFSGDMDSEDVRTALLQLQAEMQYFRVIGYRKSI